LDLQTDYVAFLDESTCECCRGECRQACLRVCAGKGLLWVAGEELLLIDPWACDGCGNCVTACPQRAISLHPRQAA
jgi:MinD superfamily P-loop ATPase